jgi:uncharacterized membrane protein
MPEKSRTRLWLIRALICPVTTVFLLYLFIWSGIGQEGQAGAIGSPALGFVLIGSIIGFLATALCLIMTLVNWILGFHRPNGAQNPSD